MSLFTVMVTVPSKAIGLTIARKVVNDGLVACVNIIPNITSVYKWEGKVEESEEFLLVMKTSEPRLISLEEEVKKLHPYDVPEFIASRVDHVSDAYGKWALEQTS